MFHDTSSVDLRLSDLRATAAALRAERVAAASNQAERPQGLRNRAESAFLAAGSALVSSTSQVRISPVGR